MAKKVTLKDKDDVVLYPQTVPDAILGVDNTPSAGSNNLVKSNGVAEELLEIKTKAFETVQQQLFSTVIGGVSYNETGYYEYVNHASSKVTVNGLCAIPAFTNGYMWNLYKYTTDTEGEEIYSGWMTNAMSLTLDGTYVFVFRHVVDSSVIAWNDSDTEVVRVILSAVTTDSSMETQLSDEIDRAVASETRIDTRIDTEVIHAPVEETYSIESGDRLSKKYNTDIHVGDAYNITFISSTNQDELSVVSVYAYNVNTSLGKLVDISVGATATVILPDDTTSLLFFNASYLESAATVVMEVVHLGVLSKEVYDLNQNVNRLNETVFPYEHPTVFCDSIPASVLAEMYFPEITNSWKLSRVTCGQDRTIVINLIDNYGDAIVRANAIADTVSPFYYKGEVIGYFLINYVEGGYSKIKAEGYDLHIDRVNDIENSPRIKDYLSRKENIVLLGDSFFGYRPSNTLLENIIARTNKFIANGGFPGCRAAWRTSDGSSDWDALCFIGVADSIASGDFSAMTTAVGNLSSSYNYFLDRIASLKSVDYTKPTTFFVNYGNNDITGGSQIGSLWDKSQTLITFDKKSLLGALNYGIAKISQAYPAARFVILTPMWRMLGSSVDPEGGTSGDAVAPYEYVNRIGVTFNQYYSAIKENFERCGIRVFDTYRMGGRSANNFDSYSVDSSHFNRLGYELFAQALSQEDKAI